MTALRIESFPCNHGINVVLTGFNSTRQRIQLKFKAKIVSLWQKSYLNAIKIRKRENRLFLQNHLPLHYQTPGIKPYQICYGFMKTTIFWTLRFSAFTKTTDTINKNKQCHMTLGGLSSVCAKLEPPSFKNSEILKINVLQRFTSRALSKIGSPEPKFRSKYDGSSSSKLIINEYFIADCVIRLICSLHQKRTISEGEKLIKEDHLSILRSNSSNFNSLLLSPCFTVKFGTLYTDQFTRRHRLVHNGGILKFEALYWSLNMVSKFNWISVKP